MGVLLSIQGGMNVAVAALLYHPADDDTVCGTDASSQLLAALVNFSCGVLTLFVLVAAHELWQWRRGAHLCAEFQRPSRWFEVCGGPLGVAILCLTVVGYNLAGFAIVAVVRAAGTAAAALTFDHFGCLGQRRRMTARRCLGVALLLLGSALEVGPELEHSARGRGVLSLLLVAALPLLPGALSPLQAAVNGRLAQRLGYPLRATLVSFVGGTLCLLVFVGACGAPPHARARLARAPGWCFLAGPLAVGLISSNFLLPKYIGFATGSAFNTFGMLLSSLLLDWAGAFGATPRAPGALRCGGVVLALCGGAITHRRSQPAKPTLLAASAARSDEPHEAAAPEVEMRRGEELAPSTP